MTSFEFKDYTQIIKVYNYASDTKEFLSEADCHVQANTGLPAHCTTIAPPEIEVGKIRIFKGDRWEHIEDHRGMVVYNTETGKRLEITELGSLPENVTIVEPKSQIDRYINGEWVANLADARIVKNSEISEWRSRQEETRFSVDYMGKKWDCDRATLDRIGIAVIQARNNNMPDGFYWTDFSNTDVPLTAEQLIGLSDALDRAMFLRGVAIHNRQREMKKIIASMDNIGKIMAFTPDWEDK